MSLRLLGGWPVWLVVLVALSLAALAWWLYFRETRRAVTGNLRWLLPTLRSAAVLLIVLTLCEPTLESEVREGEPSRIVFLVDGSESMSLTDQELGESTATLNHRYDRALTALLGPTDAKNPFELGLARQLRDRFDVEIARLEAEKLVPFWDSSQSETGPDGEDVAAARQENQVSPTWSSTTALGSGLEALIPSSSESGSSENAAANFCVLLTDGQSNAGDSPLSAVDALQSANFTLYTIGFGKPSNQSDLILRSAQCPNNFYRDDTLSGLVTVREIGKGMPYSVRILYGKTELWSSNFVSEANINHEVRFSFPVADAVAVVQSEVGNQIELSNIPLKLRAVVEAEDEASIENNEQEFFTSISSQRAKILLIDGRSRWETRYLKNMFSRDPAWELFPVITQPGETVEDSVQRMQGELELKFPTNRAELMDYNLVILGDIAPERLDSQFQAWLIDFVEAGGGLVFIDGPRGNLQTIEGTSLADLIPVRWTGNPSRLASHLELTPVGSQLEALTLEDGTTESEGSSSISGWGWSQLPELKFVSAVDPKVGGEVLVQAENGLHSTPAMVASRFGAGRVLFLATDETWRWRYQVADRHHTKIWNQLSRWVMRNPLSFEGEFLALDAGQPAYTPDASIHLRCQLRDLSGAPSTAESVTAILERDGQVVRRLTLNRLEDRPGRYASTLPGLAPGDYRMRVEAAGYTRDALNVEAPFTVLPQPSQEFQEIACNEPLLRNLASQTGGKYFPEDQIDSLLEELRPLSGGRILRQSTIIWQSYWWFCTAILLLVVEWILRKRAGLI